MNAKHIAFGLIAGLVALTGPTFAQEVPTTDNDVTVKDIIVVNCIVNQEIVQAVEVTTEKEAEKAKADLVAKNEACKIKIVYKSREKKVKPTVTPTTEPTVSVTVSPTATPTATVTSTPVPTRQPVSNTNNNTVVIDNDKDDEVRTEVRTITVPQEAPATGRGK
jgi:hypothetical protein